MLTMEGMKLAALVLAASLSACVDAPAGDGELRNACIAAASVKTQARTWPVGYATGLDWGEVTDLCVDDGLDGCDAAQADALAACTDAMCYEPGSPECAGNPWRCTKHCSLSMFIGCNDIPEPSPPECATQATPTPAACMGLPDCWTP